jgi:hypothetical protein
VLLSATQIRKVCCNTAARPYYYDRYYYCCYWNIHRCRGLVPRNKLWNDDCARKKWMKQTACRDNSHVMVYFKVLLQYLPGKQENKKYVKYNLRKYNLKCCNMCIINIEQQLQFRKNCGSFKNMRFIMKTFYSKLLNPVRNSGQRERRLEAHYMDSEDRWLGIGRRQWRDTRICIGPMYVHALHIVTYSRVLFTMELYCTQNSIHNCSLQSATLRTHVQPLLVLWHNWQVH